MIVKNIRPAISPICNMDCVYCSSSSKNKNAKMEDFRRTPPSTGVLSTEQWLEIFKCFYDAGFRGISLTGGEPTLNPDWLHMLKYCKKLGYISTELTSNLLSLDRYRKKLKDSTDVITKFKVSLDTFDKEKYYKLTRRDVLNQVLENMIFLIDTGYNVQLNRVTMKSTQNELTDYILRANAMKANINLLDLVFYKGSDSKNDFKNWETEFVSAEDTWNFLTENIEGFGEMVPDMRYGFRTTYKQTNIILKDSRLTKRAERCQVCPLYCQEGIFTVRIASDGTITTCPDYSGKLPYINGVESLKDYSLTEKLIVLFKEFEISEENYFDEYLKRHKS